MDTVEDIRTAVETGDEPHGARIQPAAHLLELSPDWIVLRASENIHRLLGESHVTLIDEPLGRFVHTRALHDLRNLFSRLSGTTGIARAYAVRLTDDHHLADIAFQLSGGRILLEAVPPAGRFGECLGTVGGLIASLGGSRGQALLDGGARRMRALTGYDRVTLVFEGRRAESNRGAFQTPARLKDVLPAIVADAEADGVGIYPRRTTGTSIAGALMWATDDDTRGQRGSEGVRASLTIPFFVDDVEGAFRCDSRTPRAPSFELHAAAELFAQMFALRLEIDRLRPSS